VGVVTGKNQGPDDSLFLDDFASAAWKHRHAVVLRNEGYGPVIDGLHVQGRWAEDIDDLSVMTSDENGTPYPFDSLDLDDATVHQYDSRPLVGIEIEGNQGGSHPVQTGKMICPTALTVSLCRVGIACVATPNQDHADQLNLTRYAARYCDVGIRLANNQSVAHQIDHFDQLLCNTAFRVDRGGNLQCNLLDMQGAANIGLHIHGGDQGADVVSGYFNFGVINIDGSTADVGCRTTAGRCSSIRRRRTPRCAT
jgi:hypothetical protein